VRGLTLKDVLSALAGGDAEMIARYSRRKLLAAFVSVCLAVHYANARGVLHRDLKPSNIMLGEFGEVYVLDWGIAKVVAGAAAAGSALTHDGVIIGTPQYMAPEQLLRKGTFDARTDVYALGMILFELLALRPLHRGRDTPEILMATLEGLDTRPSVYVADVPPELDAVCVRATACDPERRFAGTQELAAPIERYLDGDGGLERRPSLVAEQVEGAARALARPAAAPKEERPSVVARREVVRALVLDPSQPAATEAGTGSVSTGQVVQCCSGVTMVNYRDAVAKLYGPDVVSRGLARLAPDARFQLETMTTTGWIPMETVGAATEAWAEAAGVSPEELTVRAVRESVRHTFATVWRVLLRFTTDSALMARTPLLYKRIRNAGVLTVELRAPYEARLELTRWQNPTDRQLLSLATAIETVLELAGRTEVRCTFKRTADGGVFQLRWGDASDRDRALPPRQGK
jgi:hypothetical protein